MWSSYIRKLWIVIFFISLRHSNKYQIFCDEVTYKEGFLSEMGRMVGFLLQKCWYRSLERGHFEDSSVVILQECLKRRGLLAIDRALSRDAIEITDGVTLVKWKNETEVDDRQKSSRKSADQNTSKSLEETRDWSRQFLQKIVTFFKTRLLKIHLNGFKFSTVSEARGRRKNNMFGQLMMFGLVAAGLIVIPMGFQFLAVLGGKALLLAKLALLLTSIQGLKKIATSNVNYGLYSTGHGGASIASPIESHRNLSENVRQGHWPLGSATGGVIILVIVSCTLASPISENVRQDTLAAWLDDRAI